MGYLKYIILFLLIFIQPLQSAYYPVPLPSTSGNVMKSNGSKWTSAVPPANGSTGYIQYNTSGNLDSESNLFWNSTNNRLGIGTAAPPNELTINNNSDNSSDFPTNVSAGLSIIGADSANSGINIDTFATNGQITFRRANTGMAAASKSAIVSGNSLGAITWRGYGATSYAGGNRGLIQMVAGENWSDTAQGTYLQFNTVANTTTTSAEKMRLSDAGYLGIGTTSPSEILHLKSASPRLRFEDTDGGSSSLYSQISANSAVGSLFLQADPGNLGASSFIQMTIDGSNAVYIDSSQNMGVGTTTPYSKIDAAGTIRATSVGAPSSGAGLELSYGGTANTADILAYDRTGAAYKNLEMRASNIIFNTGGGGERARIDSSGLIGIGTSSPTVAVDAYNATDMTFRLWGDSTTNYFAQRSSTDANSPNFYFRKTRGTKSAVSSVATGDTLGQVLFSAYGGTNYRNLSAIVGTVETYTSDTDISSRLSFWTSTSGSASPTEKMRIDNAGNVGIGITNPTSKLHVFGGNIRQEASGDNYGLEGFASTTHIFSLTRVSNDTRLSSYGQLIFKTNATSGVSGGSTALTIATDTTATFGGGVARGYTVQTGATHTVSASDTHIVLNRAGTVTLTLPTASSYTGRELYVRTITANTVVSASSNVVPLAGGAAGTAILAATAGKWAMLVSDGTNWQIMASN